MNAQPENLPAQRQQVHPIARLSNQLEQRGDEFRKALPSHISPEKMQRTIVTAATNNPDLLRADRQSLVTSAMKAAQDGLLPDGREAALVVFNTRRKNEHGQWETVKEVQYMPMVYGLRKKIVQSGEIVSLQTGLVYRAEMEQGAFLYEVGIEPPIRHRPMLDLPAEELADDKIVAAYSMAKMKDGTVSVEVMRRGEIDKVREASMTGATKDRYGKPREPKGPWVDWFGEMARKTVMRRHSKTLPMSGDLFVDVEGQEHEASSNTARLLASVEADAPVALPGGYDDSEQVDASTGEVTSGRDPATGMTEVDEETARRLDAGEEPDETETLPAADHHGPQPTEAKHGESWFDQSRGKLRYAHQGPTGAIRWYDQPPKGDAPQVEQEKPEEAGDEAGQAEAAAETVQAIDGPLEGQAQDDEPAAEAQSEDPPWKAAMANISNMIADARDKESWQAANKELEKHYAGLPDVAAANLDKQLQAKKAELVGG